VTQGKISIELVSHKNSISTKKDLLCILKVKNIGDSSIIVPRGLITRPWNQDDADVNFLVVYNSKDTISFENSFTCAMRLPPRPWQFDELREGASRLYESTIPASYFEKPGSYKICFILYTNNYFGYRFFITKENPSIISNWSTLEVK